MARSFDSLEEELFPILNDVLDDSRVDNDTYPWGQKGEQLSYLLGLCHTAALAEKATASEDRKGEIDRVINRLDHEARRAFTRIEYFSFAQNPRPTGTIPKTPAQDWSTPLRPHTRRVEIDPIGEQVGEPLSQTGTHSEKPQGKGTAEKPGAAAAEVKDTAAQAKSPPLDDAVMSAILKQIKDEFKKLSTHSPSEQPNSASGSTSPAGSKSDLQSVNSISSEHSIPEISGRRKVQAKELKPIVQMKFDRVTLSTFDGDITKWLTFRDEFLEYVDQNDGLLPGMKLHQLKTHLSGLALEAISGFGKTAADYEAAWKLLMDRYNNDHRIVMGYVGLFYQLPFLTSNPSSNDFIKMINRTTLLMQIMPKFNYDISSWDLMLLHHLVSRLDSYSLRKWNDQIKKRQRIPIAELLEFLEVQSSEKLTARNEFPKNDRKDHRGKKGNKQPQQRANVMVATQEPATKPPEPPKPKSKCLQCKSANHPTFYCFGFRKLNVQARLAKVKENKYCIRCLNKHDGQACSFRLCSFCEGDHNRLLCFKAEKKREEKNKSDAKPPKAQPSE